jgi:hypothetical protein
MAPPAAAATVTTLEGQEAASITLPYWDGFVVRTTTSGSAPVYGVTAEVKSDAGSEAVTLVESDTRLHGSAALASLPSVDSRITLTLGGGPSPVEGPFAPLAPRRRFGYNTEPDGSV